MSKNRNIDNQKEFCDILVIGGGVAGPIAAIQAARAGANVVLVEAGHQLGGVMTTGGVNAPAYFRVGNRQIVGGIGWELVQESLELSGDRLPDFSDHSNNRPSWHVIINPYNYSLLAEEKCLEAGVNIHYFELLQSLKKDGEKWTAQFAGNMVNRHICAKEIIDCTGDAIALRLAGIECFRDGIRQPGTLSYSLSGYDYDNLNMKQIEHAYQEAMESGELRPGDYRHKDEPFDQFLLHCGRNMQHLFNADSSDSELNTAADLSARKSILRMLRFLKKQPGLEHLRLERMNTSIGIRDTWRVVGETMITRDDYMAGRFYDDAIAWTYYYVDIHHEDGVQREYLPEGIWPTIPFGALIPKGESGILTAGRTICADRAAFSAVRVQASCMAMGQAAGAAAALGVKRGIPSRDIPVNELRKLLKAHGALVPESPDNEPLI